MCKNFYALNKYSTHFIQSIAYAGMIIGIVALIWSVMLLMGVNEAGNQLDKNNINLQELNNALDDLKKEHEN